MAETVLVLPIQPQSKNVRNKLHQMQRSKLKISLWEIISLKYPRRSEPPTHLQFVNLIQMQGPRERGWGEQNIGAGSAIERIDAITALGFWFDDSLK